MLQLKNIKKNYLAGVNEVKALKDVNMSFRESEFVAILGPSGCGKTTLLNIIGGLDRYTSGDLIINGKSTKEYRDRDWDTYRNHSIGFVFQTYNLIPHQSVLANVELALTLSGVSKTERRKKAKEVLEKVGLADQINKRPNQMSGGQMQRVAIARALINDPDILLADEPTGALDSETSLQVMDLLKEIAKEKLVIMVTHNPDLANKYATRTIRLLDGEVTSDSAPFDAEEAKREAQQTTKTSMSFGTALSLSLNNLMTKKGRTILTAIAGSIGIIGIALILSLSYGVRQYIKKVEQDTLSTIPIELRETSVDLAAMMGTMRKEEDRSTRDPNKIYSRNILGTVVTTMTSNMSKNNLQKFKVFVDGDGGGILEHLNAVQYEYNLKLQIYSSDTSNGLLRVNPNSVLDSIGVDLSGPFGGAGASDTSQYDIFNEMLDNRELLLSQYDLLVGKWPEKYNEVVLVVDKHNEVSDYALYALGLKDRKEVENLMQKILAAEELEFPETSHAYNDFLNLSYRLVLNSDYYQKVHGHWVYKGDDVAYMSTVIENSEPIHVVGIIRPNEEALITSTTGEIFYTKALTEHVVNKINESEIAKEQRANPDINIFTGMPFLETGGAFDISSLTPEEQSRLASMTQEELAQAIATYMETYGATLEDNYARIGVVDLDNPTAIYLYPKNFESKQRIEEIIKDYNAKAEAEGREEDILSYTDYIGLLMSGVTNIINIISYVLIAFVSISLVVSSIMIGIITYISVLERTKEIGILRAVGASKKDISRVFNAETIIEGLAAGIFGIGFTLLINIPANIIIKNVTGVSGLVKLPINGGVILVLISVFLTVLAGLIPAKMASRKDPVEALRTE